MTKIETLASDVALLSNDSLGRLAQELIRNYPGRAEVLATFLTVYEQDRLYTLEQLRFDVERGFEVE
jgi:hypothetical protein